MTAAEAGGAGGAAGAAGTGGTGRAVGTFGTVGADGASGVGGAAGAGGAPPGVFAVSDLRVTYQGSAGHIDAVRGVSFSVGAGEAVGVVGETGCGKTATILGALRLLAEPPATVTGDYSVLDGTDLLAATRRQRREALGRKVGVVFQDPLTYLNPLIKIGHQISEGTRQHLGLGRAAASGRALELLAQVGVPDPERVADGYPHQLSGGMRQRALIAMALACAPRVLVADEPTTALDVTVQAQILDVVGEIRRQRDLALLWVSHDLAVIAQVADRILVMYAGVVVEDGPSGEVLRQPRHPYAQALVGAIPKVGAGRVRLTTIPGKPPELSQPVTGCPFAPRCPARIDRCEEAAPELVPVAAGHRVACWVALEAAS
jgi:oligopeptide/dipeptide ABC transporter ATP-binding protein